MTKTELINSIADKANCTKKDAGAALEATLAAIQEALVNGEKVSITGFGTFEVKNRPAREGRNPAPGEKVMIPAAKVPGFRAGKGLKDAVK